MGHHVFVDTCALAHRITPICYHLGLVNTAVVLTSVSFETVKLCNNSDPDKQEAGRQALCVQYTN